jgi:hypothetical protein
MAVTVYIREKGGKQKFTRAPEGPTDAQYWLSACQAGKQKWHRVGKYEDVKKAKLLLERELERVAAAKKYGFPATEAPRRITVKEAVTRYLERKRIAGKRPGTLASYRFTLRLFEGFCTRPYLPMILHGSYLLQPRPLLNWFSETGWTYLGLSSSLGEYRAKSKGNDHGHGRISANP